MTSLQTQRRVWAYLSECAAAGRNHTYQSLARAIGHPNSLQTVWNAVDCLEELGYVAREKATPQSGNKIRVVIPLLEA